MRACFYPVAAFALCGVLVSCGATEETSGAGGDDGFAASDASAGPTPGAEPSGDNPLPSDGPTQPAPNTPSPDGDGSELDPPDGGSTTAADDVDAPLTQGPEVPTEPGAAPTDDILEEGENICERQIEFDSVSLLDPPPFDVVIVADHSDSLSWSKEDLSAGLGELLAEVGGSDARFYLLTPTQYGRESAAISRMNGTDLVPWRDPVTGAAYENAMTTYVETCTDDDGVGIPCPEWEPGLDLEYTALGQFEFRMPEPIAAISKEMTEAELTKQQELIRDAILSLGGGAAFEQPLCTLARYISQAPDALPENVVFLVISDENDTTAPEECRDWIEYQQYRLDERVTDCGDDCDFNRYELTATGYQNAVTFTCTPTDDFGNPQPELAIERTLPFGFPVPTA